MTGRDKILLAGVAALLVGLGAAATFFGQDAPETEPKAAEPRETGYVDPSPPVPEGTKRLLDKALPLEEIPQEFKEAENYLESRWGHMGDSGLMAPGIMGEGDQYFQDRRLLSGVRGNGKPVFAKAFIRPEKFTGPGVKPGATQGVEMPFRASSPELTAAQMSKNVQRFKRKGDSLSKKTAGKSEPTISPIANPKGENSLPDGKKGKSQGSGQGGGGRTGGD